MQTVDEFFSGIRKNLRHRPCMDYFSCPVRHMSCMLTISSGAAHLLRATNHQFALDDSFHSPNLQQLARLGIQPRLFFPHNLLIALSDFLDRILRIASKAGLKNLAESREENEH